MPRGCPFAGRCPLTLDACRATPLPTIELAGDRRVRCLRVDAGWTADMTAPLLEVVDLVKVYRAAARPAGSRRTRPGAPSTASA